MMGDPVSSQMVFMGNVLFADCHVGAAALGGPPKCSTSPGFGPPRGGGPYT